MNFDKFCEILNKHIFLSEKKELLRKLANNPERFIGLFRPTKPSTKVLQYLLQSHEIRMGDALEEIIEEILKDIGFEILPKNLVNENMEQILLDQYFTDGKMFYFIEQKVRDDHDSTKKRGQISNFETKLKSLHKRHHHLIGIMYFIDPDLSKNKNYYIQELNRLEESYGVKISLYYGRNLFEFLGKSEIWDNILNWLRQWKDSIPELPEINFDASPQESFNEIKDINPRDWKKILENQTLWEEGIINAIFRKGTTLQLLLEFFRNQRGSNYIQLASLLTERLNEYYEKEI